MSKHGAAAEGEKGHLYAAEKPHSYNEGQTGKGVSIGGKVTAKGGSPMPVGGDKQAGVLKKVWNRAASAAGRFPPV